jgi:ABC-type uncharacterized transport system substrate-binding protein
LFAIGPQIWAMLSNYRAPRSEALSLCNILRVVHVVDLRKCILALITLIVCGTDAAFAHPHVWVTAKSEIIFAPDGSISGVRHTWTFDDMFSAYALQGVATAKKGLFTRDELAPLALTNVEALKDFGYFTFAKAESKKQPFAEPTDYYLECKNDLLILHFTLSFKAPVRTKQLVLEIFDPTFFVSFSMEKQDPVSAVGASTTCKVALRPQEAVAPPSQNLNEDNFLNGDTVNYGAIFTNHITVACP